MTSWLRLDRLARFGAGPTGGFGSPVRSRRDAQASCAMRPPPTLTTVSTYRMKDD